MTISKAAQKLNTDDLKALTAPDPATFERLMLEKVFPFLASNALIIGLFALYELRVVSTYFLVIPTALIAIPIGTMRFIHPASGPLSNILHGTLMVLCSLILFMTIGGASYFVLSYIISFAFAYAVVKNYFPQASMWYYMFYVPFLWGFIYQDDTTTRLLVTFPLVLILFVVFILTKKNLAATASITATVFAAFAELLRTEQYQFGFMLLLAAALVGAIIYELKIISTGASDIKMFLRQGILVMIMLFLIIAVYSVSDTDVSSVVWTWFFFVLVYEVVQISRSKMAHPARLGWIMFTLLVCLISEIEDDALFIALALTLVALCNVIIAMRYQSRFLYNISLVFLLFALYLLLHQSETSVSALIILTGILTWACLVLLTGVNRIQNISESRWWTGFIKKEDLETLKHYSELVVDKISKVPVLGGMVSLITSFVEVLRNIKGKGAPLGYLDFVFIVSQFFVIEVITNQIERMDMFTSLPSWQRHSVEIVVYIFFGLVLFVSGALSSNLFLRLLGIAIFLYPLSFNSIEDGTFHASTGYLYGVTGLVVAAIYVIYVPKKVSEKTEENKG